MSRMISLSDIESRIVLNVGGTRFETMKSTLKKLPATRLSKLTEQLSHYDPVLNEYFFDRNPNVFSQVLNYYRTGKLHYPTNVCGPLFEDELSYWGLQREDVEPCCWMTYTRHRSTQETLQIIDSLELDTLCSTKEDIMKKFHYEDEILQGRELSTGKRIRTIIWQIFEESRSSTISKIITVISVFFILISIMSFMLQTMSVFNVTEINFVTAYINSTTMKRMPTPNGEDITQAFQIIQWTCNAWFIFEITIRFIVSPNKTLFCKSAFNIIDFLATFWFVLTYILTNIFHIPENEGFDLISTIRVVRIFRLCTLHPGLKIIVIAMQYSSTILWLLIFFVFTAIALTASFIYYAERSTPNEDNYFTSIPDSLWFSMITVTTIGYGDLYPKTLLGMLVGAVTTIAGVLIIDLPMPIIVETFANFNTHLTARSKLPKKRRKIAVVEKPRKVQVSPLG